MSTKCFTTGGSWGLLKLALALFLLLTLIAPGQQDSLAVGTTIYVDADASGTNDGSSWDNAFTDLQDGLTAAQADDEIWVAAGTYYPGTNREDSFAMKNQVAIYGGFDPTTGDVGWDDRDWVANETILSGDIGTPGNNADNCYHVFYHPSGSYLDSTAILDGFSVIGGNAHGPSEHSDGGGMYNWTSSPTLTNCTFEGNSAYSAGGGMVNHSSSSPTLTDCTFSGNTSDDNGGGMVNYWSSPILTNCTFEYNSAATGGGMYNRGSSSPTLTSCTFESNSAGQGGGMSSADDSSPALSNSTFSDNSATAEGGGLFSYESATPTLTNCTFSDNSAASGGGMFSQDLSSPALINSIFWGDSPNEIAGNAAAVTYTNIQGGYTGEGNIDADPLFVDPGSGDYHLGDGSPCIDAGTNDAPDLPPYDFEGDNRIIDGDGDGTPTVDMGVDEVAIPQPYFRIYLPLVVKNH